MNDSPCHRKEVNPNIGPYMMFQMIISFVTMTFQNMLVFEILNEGKWCWGGEGGGRLPVVMMYIS